MPLPAEGSPWPPTADSTRYTRMRTTSTWYGGDPDQLADLYGGALISDSSRNTGGTVTRTRSWFWGAIDDSGPEGKVHVPLAQDIATHSSELLFADPPRFVVQPVELDDEGKPTAAEAVIVADLQQRLDDILDGSDMPSLLLGAAETGTALGSVGLRIVYDTATMTMPRLTRVDADHVIPEYQWGALTAVTFWRVLDGGDTGGVWRHLERHEPGRIVHALYVGGDTNLGDRRPLAAHAATAVLVGSVDDDGAIATAPDYLTAVSIPNALPDPLDRGSEVGRSDFSPGVLSMFDSIDRLYSSLMRDVEDGESKLIVADYMLETAGRGQGAVFDRDRRLFTGLDMQPTENGDAPITQVQFSIRVDDHLKAIAHLTDRAMRACGYNSDEENGQDGGDMTATEYSGRSKRSSGTRDKKLRYWRRIEPLIEALLAVDAAKFSTGRPVRPVSMIVPDAFQPDMAALVQTASLMATSLIASLHTIVAYLHPDWDDERVQREVDAITAEKGAAAPADPATFGRPGGDGDGAGAELDPDPDDPDGTDPSGAVPA